MRHNPNKRTKAESKEKIKRTNKQTKKARKVYCAFEPLPGEPQKMKMIVLKWLARTYGMILGVKIHTSEKETKLVVNIRRK